MAINLNFSIRKVPDERHTCNHFTMFIRQATSNLCRTDGTENLSLVFHENAQFFIGKRGADGKLSSAQTALMLQEETIRRLERERKTLNEKMEALETSLANSDAERRQLKDKVAKLQLNDSKIEQEKEAMRSQIENAESRITRIELKKRGVEGNIDFMK